MQSRINSILLVCLVSSAYVSFAQEIAAPSFPYVAEITADDVYIRSGPGTNYYHCAKLNKGDRVKMVGSKFSWSRIVPPAGSFSWISKQYVSIDTDNPTIGVVTGDNVRVWVGSEHLKPIHSTTCRIKLNRDEKVKLMGEEMDDYYKIAPPSGAYRWVSTQYTRPYESVGQVEPTVETRPDVQPETKPDVKPEVETVAVVPVKLSVEAGKLKEYYALENKVKAERDKPMAQQNYAELKKAFREIAANKESGKAARYSEFALGQIKRYELALEVSKTVRLQGAQLQKTTKRIEKARATRLAKVPELGRFAVIGQLQTSNIYSPSPELKHYRIVDDSGKTICYALASGPASKMDLSKLIGRKVGLVGTIEPHPATAGALVRFNEITQLK